MNGADGLDLETEGYAEASAAEGGASAEDLNLLARASYPILAVTAVGASYLLDAFVSWKLSHPTGKQDADAYISADGQARVGRAVDTESVWREVADDPSHHSTQDIVERIHARVMTKLDYDDSLASTGIDAALGTGKGICFDYSGMTYSALLKLAHDHPELAGRLQDVRWTFGLSGDEHIGHAWLQLRGADGAWHDYDATVDFVSGGVGSPELVHQYPPVDYGGYTHMGHVSADAGGAHAHSSDWGGIVIPRTGAGEQLFNQLEEATGHNVPADIERYVPETLVLVAGAEGAYAGVRAAAVALWRKLRGGRGERVAAAGREGDAAEGGQEHPPEESPP